MRRRSTHAPHETILHRPWAAFTLTWIAVSSAGCTRDNPAKRTTENAANTASVSTGAAIGTTAAPAPSSSAAEVAPMSPSSAFASAQAPEKLPPWASRAPQPAVPSALFARGITGPINDTFEGILACQITVSGSSWDPLVPFVGSAAGGLPDIRAELGDAVIFLPADTPSGTLIFAGMKLTKDSRLKMNISDVDLVRNDPIEEVSLDASKGFPLEAKSTWTKLVCRGVPRSALTADIKPREAALERALTAMDKSTSKIDLARPEASRKEIDVAQKAVLELAAYVGLEDAYVRSSITRIATVEMGLEVRYVEALDAELAKHPKSEFQSLPSARVRCHPTRASMVEIEVGSRALKQAYPSGDLGPLQFRFISKTGIEFAPTFTTLRVNGEALGVESTIPAKGLTAAEIVATTDQPKPYAILVREGAKRAYLCPYVSPW